MKPEIHKAWQLTPERRIKMLVDMEAEREPIPPLPSIPKYEPIKSEWKPSSFMTFIYQILP